MRYTLAILLAATTSTGLAQGSPLPNAAPNYNYSRYTAPGQCQAAATRMQQLYWRDKRPDTVVYAPLTDSVPASVKRSIQACAARFTVANTPERELLSLVQLYLWIGQDDQARAAADRLIAAQSNQTPTQRGWIVRLVAGSFLSARPTRLPDANKYLAQLDAIGAPANEWRVRSHTQFGSFAVSLDDRPTALSEFNAAFAAADSMTPQQRMNALGILLRLYGNAAEATGAQNGSEATLRLLDKGKGALVSLRPAESEAAQRIAMQMNQLSEIYKLYGEKGAPLVSTHLYTTDGDTARPKPGIASLLVFGSASCGGGCYSQYAVIRRLQAKYGSALKTTIMTGTYGFFRNQAVINASVEADSAKKYFFDFLKLPAALAVTEVEFTRKVDGRRISTPTPNGKAYYRGLNAIVVGRDGKIRLMADLDTDRERLLDNAIAAQ